jgi:replicative DNA helicase
MGAPMTVGAPIIDGLLAESRGFLTLGEQVAKLKEYSLNPQQRIRTGLDAIDIYIEGPACGEVCVFLGRSYSGKSIIAQNIMWRNAHTPLMFFSLEMHYFLALQRLFAMWSNIPNNEVHEATSAGHLPIVIDQMPDDFANHVIIDQSGLTPGDMWKYIKQYNTAFGCKPAAIIVDYLELIGGAKTSGEGWLGTEKVAQEMKELAKNVEIPVFLIHQSNKEEKPWLPPTMDSARGGGFTEADFVVGMWRPYLNPKLEPWDRDNMENEVHFNILKNRPFGRHNRKPIEMLLTPSLRLVSRELG